MTKKSEHESGDEARKREHKRAERVPGEGEGAEAPRAAGEQRGVRVAVQFGAGAVVIGPTSFRATCNRLSK